VLRAGVSATLLSPDFNPIEQAFSKVKGLMRAAEARTREALIEAMGRAFSLR
jgi:transposase